MDKSPKHEVAREGAFGKLIDLLVEENMAVAKADFGNDNPSWLKGSLDGLELFRQQRDKDALDLEIELFRMQELDGQNRERCERGELSIDEYMAQRFATIQFGACYEVVLVAHVETYGDMHNERRELLGAATDQYHRLAAQLDAT